MQLINDDFRNVELQNVKAIITDPPYARKHWQLYEDLGQWSTEVLVPNMGHLLTFLPSFELDKLLPRITKSGLRHWWTIAYYMNYGPHVKIREKGIVVRHKPIGWFLNGKKDNSIGYRVDHFITMDRPQKGLHKWQQTLRWAEWLIESFTDPGDLVCDPMMGSGTVGEACRNLNREFVGIDVDPAAYETARERLLR